MIKKITGEEFEQLGYKAGGRATPAYNAIIGLRQGEAVVIPKTDWRSRTKTPSSKCRRIEKKFATMKVKYKCVELTDGSGWAVKRLA